MAVFPAVLFVVFEVSARIDSVTAAKLVEWVLAWQRVSTIGFVGRAVVVGLIGLVGIVVPVRIPLVLLVASGVMQRIALSSTAAFTISGCTNDHRPIRTPGRSKP